MKTSYDIIANREAGSDVKSARKCKECNYVYPIIVKDDVVIYDSCPRCLVEKENEQFRNDAEQLIKERKVDSFNHMSVISEDLKIATFDNYIPHNHTQEKALNTVKAFSNYELDNKTLFFQGDTGLGKSHLAYCAHKKFNSDYKSSIFIDVPGLMSLIKSTYGMNKNFTSQEEIMEKISKAELLVLDDIGAEYVKPDANGFESWAADILYQISNDRQGKKNIYTTNFTSEFLNKKYGMMSKRIISRLMNDAKVIRLEGKDQRLNGLK